MGVRTPEKIAGAPCGAVPVRRRPVVRPTVPRPELSDREIEVLLAWFAAESKGAAGRTLFITPTTVATHISRVRAKYSAVGRAASSKTALFARLLEDGHTALNDW